MKSLHLEIDLAIFQEEQSFGSMLELSWRGSRPVPLRNIPGEERKFLKDGDNVIIRGFCKDKDGKKALGFGHVEGRILPANKI